jgi:hypothetical protein
LCSSEEDNLDSAREGYGEAVQSDGTPVKLGARKVVLGGDATPVGFARVREERRHGSAYPLITAGRVGRRGDSEQGFGDKGGFGLLKGLRSGDELVGLVEEGGVDRPVGQNTERSPGQILQKEVEGVTGIGGETAVQAASRVSFQSLGADHPSLGCPYWAGHLRSGSADRAENQTRGVLLPNTKGSMSGEDDMQDSEDTRMDLQKGRAKNNRFEALADNVNNFASEMDKEDDIAVYEEMTDIGTSDGSGAGLKMKRLARAGMRSGGDSLAYGAQTRNGTAEEGSPSYAEMLKGQRDRKGKKVMESESMSEMSDEAGFTASLEGEEVRCIIEEEHYEGVVSCFKDSTILVHFLGRPPNEVELRKWLQELWNGRGWFIERLRYLGKGYYAVIFDENVRIREVLKEGPWYFKGGLVLVQPWEPDFSVDHGAYGRHPAWVELCNLPVHLWQFARSFFESIGTVISFDEGQKFTFRPHARACVLVDTNKELPKKLVVRVGNKVKYEIKILILGLPNACFRCKQSGHFIRNCPYKTIGEQKTEKSGGPSSSKGKAAMRGEMEKLEVQVSQGSKEGRKEVNMEDQPMDEEEVVAVSPRQERTTNQTTNEAAKEGQSMGSQGEQQQTEVNSLVDRKGESKTASGKENIPPKGGNLPPLGRTDSWKQRQGKGVEDNKEEEGNIEPSNAIIPYGSPPPPTIGDFLVEALEARSREATDEDRGNGFQMVKRKAKRIPLTAGAKEETRVKGKVQKLCLEWDAKGSQ